MISAKRHIAAEYAAALQDYLTSSGEPALQRAYELGRRALGEGLGLLALVSRHHAVLHQALQREQRGIPELSQFEAAQTFLAESLSPFEMAQREFRDAVTALGQMNQKLEKEAQRIAHALHDEASQLLVSVHLSLHELARDHPIVNDRIQAARGQLDEVEQQLRRLARELRPTILDNLGLMPALEELARGVTARTGIPVQVRGPKNHRLPFPVETAVYRAVQEALTNAIRHGMPRRVRVWVDRELQGVRCRVRDDGVGFDTQQLLRASNMHGLGLSGMRERLNNLGGSLTIRSRPGHGCELTMDVPVEVNDANTPTPGG